MTLSTADFALTSTASGTLKMRFAPGATIDLRLAQTALETANVKGGAGYRLIVVLSGLRDVTTEARFLLSNASGPIGVALVVSSAVDRVVGNMFIGLARNASYKIHVFTDETAAEAWLKEL